MPQVFSYLMCIVYFSGELIYYEVLQYSTEICQKELAVIIVLRSAEKQ